MDARGKRKCVLKLKKSYKRARIYRRGLQLVAGIQRIGTLKDFRTVL